MPTQTPPDVVRYVLTSGANAGANRPAERLATNEDGTLNLRVQLEAGDGLGDSIEVDNVANDEGAGDGNGGARGTWFTPPLA